MNSNVLQEKNDSYGCTTFYLVHNQQEPVMPVASFLQMNQQVTNANDQLSNNLRSYYENNDIVENDMVTINAADLTRNANVQQNYVTRKIDYVILPNVEQKNQQERQVFTSENITASHSLNIPSTANVRYVSDDQIFERSISNKQISKSLHPLPKKISKKPKTKALRANLADRTSVCLLKVGNTYHSVTNLSEEQTKLVSQAIQNINPENGSIKSTYDTTTNTRVIYKVVSPNDLKVINKNKNSRNEIPMDIDKKEKTASVVETSLQTDDKKKVTRSGRTVKTPKYIQPVNEGNHKCRKKPSGGIRCFQCSAEFRGIYQLQRHYGKFPTHTPANQHTNLFHCLLAILKSCNIYDKTNVFIQQLELLIGKLKLLFPCLLHRSEENIENTCTISEDLGRLLGISPGKYNLNMDAIYCIKDANGYCKHNPQKTVNLTKTSDPSKPSQLWLTKHKEEIANNDPQNEDCARTNSIDKWPAFNKRSWKVKSSVLNNNDVSPIPDNKEDFNDDNQINIIEKVLDSHDDTQGGILSTNQSVSDVIANNLLEDKNHDKHKLDDVSYQISDTESDICNTPIKFHSAHFDIRSSPIKPTSNVFNKIQIRPKMIPKFDLRQPIYAVNGTEDVDTQQATDQSLDLPIFTNIQVCNQNMENSLDNIEIICKEVGNPINYNSKDWPNNPNISDLHETYTSNDYIDPSMMHISKPVENCPVSDSKDLQKSEHDINEKSRLQSSSVLHLLDSLGKDCLNFSDSELRNNSIDIPLDLFSFNNN